MAGFYCVRADYHNERHKTDLLELLNEYACDPMGGGQPLSEKVKQKLVPQLATTNTAITLLCYDNDRAIGLINAFEGFSTFAAAPLINLHDVFIKKAYRGQGALQLLYETLEKIAIEKQCCKLTLEVLSNNEQAQAAYKKLGFAEYQLKKEAGQALFWQKNLEHS